jgi:hypothetical protein
MTKFAVFIKKVLVAHLDKKFPTFYLTWLKVYYCGHKSQPLDSILRQMNPVHSLSICF